MRICLLSIYSEVTDGSFQKFAFHLDKELSQHHKVLHLNLRSIFSLNFWRETKRFHPQIIHYTPGPGLRSFILVKLLASWCRGTKTVMTALQPSYSSFSKRFIPLFRPDLILVQSHQTGGMLSNSGCRTKLLLGGVDIAKFVPASPETKGLLRQKYGLDERKFTILNVAPIVKGRGLELLGKIARERDYQIIILGSTATKVDYHLLESLKASGCIVWPTYFNNIEEIYMLSDCYIFPSPLWCRHRMELPLSVMEAMSCNLPVISTRFGALPEIFEENKGLIFVENEEQFLAGLEAVKNGIKVGNREKVLSYSWEKVEEKLKGIYEELTQN